jgi:hypothetical protein
VTYSIDICGTETVSSKGPINLIYDVFGIGVDPKTEIDFVSKMSDNFISSSQNCPITSAKLVKNIAGDEITDSLVKILNGDLVVDLS